MNTVTLYWKVDEVRSDTAVFVVNYFSRTENQGLKLR